MSFGILAGAVAMAILSMFGHILWGGVCVSIGMLPAFFQNVTAQGIGNLLVEIIVGAILVAIH
jgi:hypothetical protein